MPRIDELEPGDGILPLTNGGTGADTPQGAADALPVFGSGTKGLVPPSGGGTVNFLRADMTFAAPAGGGAGVTDGDKGDITVSGSGATWTIDADAVTYAKLQNVSATDRLLGRDTAAAGDVEELTVGGGIEFTGTGGIRTSAFTGDVTKTAGGTATTIANAAVSNAKLANMATGTIKGRVTAAPGVPEDLTGTQATTLLNAFTSTLKGVVPPSGFTHSRRGLRSDGSWKIEREVLGNDLEIYVAITGSNTTGDGTIGAPFRTPQKAIYKILGDGVDEPGLDLNGWYVYIQMGDGTYTNVGDLDPLTNNSDPVLNLTQSWVGGGRIYILGNDANPEAVIFQGDNGGASTGCVIDAQTNGIVVIDSIRFQGWHSNIFVGFDARALVYVDNCVHGYNNNGNDIEVVGTGSYVIVRGTDKLIAADRHSHIYCRQGSRVMYFVTTLICDNLAAPANPLWNDQFLRVHDPGSCIIFQPPALTGFYNGPPYAVRHGGKIVVWETANWNSDDGLRAAFSGEHYLGTDPNSPYDGILDTGGEILWTKPGGDHYNDITGERAVEYLRFNSSNYVGGITGAPTGYMRLRSPPAYSENYDTFLPAIPGIGPLTRSVDGSTAWGGEPFIPALANMTFYVATTGSDSNAGTVGAPFLTIQRAIAEIIRYDWLEIYRPLIQVADGTYLTDDEIRLPRIQGHKFNPDGSPEAILQGNTTTPANVHINYSGRDAIWIDGGSWVVKGFKITCNGGNAFMIGGTEYGSVLLAGGLVLDIDESAFCVLSNGNYFGYPIGGPTGVTILTSNIHSLMQVAGGYCEFAGMTFTFQATTSLLSAFYTMFGGTLIDYTDNIFVNSGGISGMKYSAAAGARLVGPTRDQIPGSLRGTHDASSTLQDEPYVYATPASGATVTTIAGQQSLVLNPPAAPTAALTVQLPRWMEDAERFRISSTKAITALTITTTDASAVVGAPAGLAASGAIEFLYKGDTNTWYIA